MAKDYYKILGVEKRASKEDLKKAFHKLAHKFHPDRGGDAEKFKEINEAYQVLSNEKRRAEYDTYGDTFSGTRNGAAGMGGFDWSNVASDDFTVDFGDLFGEFFGNASRGGVRKTRGRDISIDLEITFAESIFGTERTTVLNRTLVCGMCAGSGGKQGTPLVKCSTCNGKGQIKDILLGTFTTVRMCHTCYGKGEVPKDVCTACRGRGVEERQEELRIQIPPGIDDGEMIRLSGQGEATRGGISGDLYVKIHVEQHPAFRREGYNLTTDLPVKLTDAMLGAEYTLDTLDGRMKLTIPKGIAHGELLRVKEKGVPRAHNKRGDLLVRVLLKMPKQLSKTAERMIEQLRAEGL